MGFLSNIFGSKPAIQQPAPIEDDPIVKMIGLILITNFTLLGWEPCQQSIHGNAGDKWSRGYLFGMSEALAKHYRGPTPTPADIVNALETAFAMTFGADEEAEARSRMFETVELFRDEDTEVHLGYASGSLDAKTTILGTPFDPPLALYHWHERMY